MTDHDPEALPPRNAWGLLLSRGFGTYFAARLSTSMGTWLHSVVAAIVAFEATGSALFVGAVSAVQFLPQVLFGSLAGKWADQGGIKFQIILGRVLTSIGSLTMAVWYFFFDQQHPSATGAVILLSSVVFGVGLVVGGPALQSTPPLLVTQEELPAAMALNTAPMTIGRIAGPVVGAAGVAWLGYGFAFLMGAMLSLIFILLVVSIRFPSVEGQEKGAKHSMREAFSFVRADRPVLLSLVGITAVGLGSEPIVTLAPALTAEFGEGSETVGVMVTSMGLGAAVGLLISSALAARLHHQVVSFVGILIMAVSLTVCAIPLPKVWAMVAFAATGFGFIISQSSLGTIIQQRIPPLLRGRIMALWLIGFVGSRPLGGLLVGGIADLSTFYIAFGVVGLFMFAAAFVCRPGRLAPGSMR
jgi:MFS family permease